MLPTPRSRRMRFAAAVGALALTASTFMATALLNPSPAMAAPGDPFPAADPLVFVAQGSPTGLYQAVTDSSGTVSFQPEGPVSGVTYNSIAYNTADNYLYALSTLASGTIPANSLLRIGQEGSVTRVGTATYPASNAGAFGADGLYYVTSSAAGYRTLTGINTTTGAVARTVTLSQPATTADITYADGFFWGQAPDSSGNSQIVRIDPATGEVTFFGAPFGTGAFAGASWTFGNGNLGFSENASGTVSQVSVTDPASANPTFTLVAQSEGPSSSNNDGAASPGQPTDLSILKTGPAATVPAGGTVTYSLTVTNNGPGNSSGFVVNDTLPAALTNVETTSDACTVTGNSVQCIGGRLLAGDSVTYTVTATVPEGVTTAIENSATVTSNEVDPVPGNNTSTTTALPSGISIVKNAGTPVDINGNGLVDTGDTIQYTFDITNTGESELTDITVNDALVGAVICPTTTLAGGGSTTCAAESVYVITAQDVADGSVDNSATVTGTTPDGVDITSAPSTTTTATTAPAPGIELVKSAAPSDAASFSAGQEVTYSFTVTNSGNVPLNDVAVNESGFTGTGDLSAISCPATSLAVGAQFVCTATYTLTQADVDAGSVTNNATAAGTPTGSTTPISSSPSNVTIPTPAAPALAVSKTASTGAIVAAGQEITYSFRVTNNGNVTMSDVAVAEGTFTGSGELSAVDCPTTTLVPGQIVTCTATYTVTQADIDAGGTLGNTATVSGTTPGGDPIESDPSTVTVPVTQTSGLTVVKSSDVESAEVGETVTYSFRVTNTGNTTVTDPAVADTEFSGSGELSAVTCPAGALAPGDDVTCTATYTVTQADVDAGELTNVATATGSVPDGVDPIEPVPSNQVTVGTNPLPLLEVTKTADTEQVTEAGQVVTYSFQVENTGNVTITDPVINEAAFSGNGELSAITCPEEDITLAPGDSVTCSATYTVVEADITGGGPLTNTATVGGTTPGGDPIVSVPSTVTVDAIVPTEPGEPTPTPDPSDPPAPTPSPSDPPVATPGPSEPSVPTPSDPATPAGSGGGATPGGLAATGAQPVGSLVGLALALIAAGALVLSRRKQLSADGDDA